jgi:hypothetical protein
MQNRRASPAPSRWSSGPGTTLVLEVGGDGGCDGEDGARGPRSAATQVWIMLRRVPLLFSPYPCPVAIELSSFLLSLNPRRLLSTAGFDIRSRFPL